MKAAIVLMAGTSGIDGARCVVVTAGARSLPALMWLPSMRSVAKVAWICPPSRS